MIFSPRSKKWLIKWICSSPRTGDRGAYVASLHLQQRAQTVDGSALRKIRPVGHMEEGLKDVCHNCGRHMRRFFQMRIQLVLLNVAQCRRVSLESCKHCSQTSGSMELTLASTPIALRVLRRDTCITFHAFALVDSPGPGWPRIIDSTRICSMRPHLPPTDRPKISAGS